MTQPSEISIALEQCAGLGNEKTDPDIRRELFEQIVGKSSRETEALIAHFSPILTGESPGSPKLVEKEKPLPNGYLQISLVADSELVAMLQRLKEVISYQSAPSSSYLELFKKVCSIALLKLDPLERAKRAEVRKEKKIAAVFNKMMPAHVPRLRRLLNVSLPRQRQVLNIN